MATLSIINNFSLDSNGRTKTGKQGTSTDDLRDAFAITVTGTCHFVEGTLAADTVVTVYDDDNDVPANWDYLYYWADQISYIQIIAAASNAIFKIAAKQPFVLPGYDSMLAAGDTTIITGGSQPSIANTIDSIVIGNYVTATTMNYLFAVID